ncbi:succinate dehydrogenase cytochrome b subunit [Pseudonocardia sp.]|jgi:succinate dehydrogenase / fumarate reductase cytochrome b subunit|uniref:succinate dehydrogenase cytochrome b subunit n=1 Tax=Pseudonocardia sp. TaxID=60912 RepID=UPI00261BF01F|nr:succinate dehydrogenase cytochrome b subunit [Pseudonocardia sp.]MCW2720309.1 succinate dehydrogenase (or fumarate reductase) cytochrome b subunit, b558 family [Pseudonocardia sp.]MDT7613391.1 succinate dehydrogenase / fumarate reductase, cytochrome b subunit [Pseudonocardiales bacterium]
MVTVQQRPRGAGVRRLRNTSLQLKILMAVTGAIVVLYLLLHMIGNLKIFLGQNALDTYAAFLRTMGEPALPYSTLLWIIRVVLTVSIVLHIVSAVILARRAARARPVKYAARPKTEGSYAARTMRWGGVIILLFIVWHILDLTTGTLNPNGVSGAVYDNVVTDFAPSRWYITLLYTVAVIAVGLHLRHGVWSALQTLGYSNGARQHVLQTISWVFALVLTVGFLSVPFAVTFGLVG